MATRVQYKESSLADPASATMGAAPTQGNLLILHAFERQGTTAANFTMGGITGWTGPVITANHELAVTTQRLCMGVFYKIAGASESATVTVDNGTANNKMFAIQEFALEAGESFTYLESAYGSEGSDTGIDGSCTCGTTGSVSGGSFLVVSVGGYKKYPDAIRTISFTNGANDWSVTIDATASLGVGSAFLSDTTTGARTDTINLNAVELERAIIGGILVFRLTAAGGGSASMPVFMSNYRRLRN